MAEPEPGFVDRLRGKAADFAAAGAWHDAASSARRLLLLRPDDALGAYYLSLATGRLGQDRVSGVLARWSLRAIPHSAVAPLHRELFTLLGLSGDALPPLRRAVLVAPGNGAGLFNLSNAEIRSRNYDAALIQLRRADIVRPLHAPTLASIARVGGLMRDGIGNAHAFTRAVALTPADSGTLRNFGLWWRRWDRPDKGALWFRRAAVLDPASREIQGELGRALLTDGQMQEGWARLERFRMPAWDPPRAGLPRWDGASLRDGALLLWSMDQVGDELLFSLFLERARERAGRLIVIVDRRNIGLLSRLHPEIRFFSDISDIAVDDPAWRPAAGYPLDFVGRFFAGTPAQLSDPECCPAIARRAMRSKSDPLRIGISWKSDASLVGVLKSTALSDWTRILSVPGCRFFSLQYGDIGADLAAFPQIDTIPDFDPFGPTLAFAETVADFDLVITVANTTAHVAGRTLTPVWVLLPKGLGCSWFWFRARTDSPLYANATLYRQSQPGDWSDAFKALETALGEWVRRTP